MCSVARPIQKSKVMDSKSSRLDREGAIIIDNNGLYTLQYLAEAYPEQIYNSVIRKCPVVEGQYVYGASWLKTLKKVIGSEHENPSSTETNFLTASEVARIIQCSVDSVERLISTGALPASNLSPIPGAGRAMWRIRRQDLDDLILKRQSVKNLSFAQLRPVLKQTTHPG